MIAEHAVSVHESAAAPYATSSEHLSDMLVRFDWLIKRQIARGHARKPAAIVDFAAVREPKVQRLLDGLTPDATSDADVRWIDQTLHGLQRQIATRVEQSHAHGVRLPLVELARRFALTAREIDLLFACAVVELDRRYERIYGFLHDDMSRRLASPGIAIALHATAAGDEVATRSLLNAHAPLRHFRLIDIVDDGTSTPWLSRSIRVDERIVSFIVGDHTIDPRIARHETWLGPSVDPRDGTATGHDRDEILERVLHLAGSSREPGTPLIYLHRVRHSDGDRIVRRAAACLNMPVIAVDTELLPDSPGDFDLALFRLFREALLSQGGVYLRNIDRALEHPSGASRYRALVRCATEMGTVVFASGDASWCWPLPQEPVALRIVALRADDVVDQMNAWQTMSNNELGDGELHRLVSLHPMPVAAIRDVWRMAQATTENYQTVPSLEQVEQACRTFAGAQVSALARRIEPKHQWSDLVLPEPQLEQLALICSQAKHASIVYGEWRFEQKLSFGRGLNAMFVGQPGTGKTMAAEVIAADLGVDLLTIDLSQIGSNYSGNAEKYLREVFDAAASANAILFFDGADALLGRRPNVRDAQDRHANTEAAYLVRKIEEHPGITILTTNLRQNVDTALTQRMRFVVDFPFPEDDDRIRIWRSVWPPEVPLAADVDLPSLARQFRLAGGSIRNVALAAAFLAAEQQQPVSMRHLIRATVRELQKTAGSVNEDERRRYG